MAVSPHLQARRTWLHKSASRLPLGALVVLRVTSDAFRISLVGHLDEVILSLVESSAHLTDLTHLTLISKILHEDYNYKDWTTYWPSHFSNNYLRKKKFSI